MRACAMAKFSRTFPELKVSNEDRESRASGSVGNGVSHIVINNQHEGVEIRKASAVATPAAAPVPPVPAKPGKALRAPKRDSAAYG